MGPKSGSNIFGIDIMSRFAKRNELLTYLSDLHSALAVMGQEVNDHPKGLKNTAIQLISSKILDHADKDVRLLSCCCIVDMLRVFAPEAPYEDEDMVRVFNSIVAQLRGLAVYDKDTTVGKQIVYILTNLSTVKSCVVPMCLIQSGVDGADEVANAMLDAVLSSVRPEHGDEIFNHCVSILQACIEELDEIPQEMLDTLLFPLLPASQKENPLAYRLIGTVLRKVAKSGAARLIKIPITAFIKEVLGSGEGASRGGGRNSELAEHVYPLLYELHKISADLLDNIIPDLAAQLQAENEEVRLRVVALLSQLFASACADYETSFGRHFREFLGRFQDQSAAVRKEVIKGCCAIGDAKPALSAMMEDPLTKRLRDPDVDVRLAALSRLLEMGFRGGALALSVSTLEEIGERAAKDKKSEMRKAALIGLSRMYGLFVANRLPPLGCVGEGGRGGRSSDATKLVDEAVLERYRAVPGILVGCWGYPDIGTKHMVLQLLQEYLLPGMKATAASSAGAAATASSQATSQDASSSQSSSSSEGTEKDACERRATALLLLFALLEEEDRPTLGVILAFKTRLRNVLDALLKSKAAAKSTDPAVLIASARKHCVNLVQILPTADKKITLCEKLLAVKDKIVFRLLGDCVAFRDSARQSSAHKEELKKRLDSKSALGEYFGIVFDFASGLLANAQAVAALVRFASTLGLHENARLPCDLLALLAKNSPLAFDASASEMAEWLESTLSADVSAKQTARRDAAAMQIVSVLSATTAAYGDDAKALNTLLPKLVRSHDSIEMVERLAELVGQLAIHSSEEAAVSLLRHLASTKVLSTSNPRLACDLTALAAMVRLPAVVYRENRYKSPSFLGLVREIRSVRERVGVWVKELLRDATELEAGSGGVTDAVAAVCAALKVATSVLSSDLELARLAPIINLNETDEAVRSPSGRKGGAKGTPGPTPAAGFTLLELTSTIFDALQSCESLGKLSAVEEDAALTVHECAAQCAISLMKLSEFPRILSVSHWHTLGWTFLGAAKERLLAAFNAIIGTYPVHPQFLAYSCLYAVEEEPLASCAEQALLVAVQRQRSTHEQLCSQMMSSESEAENARLAQMAAFHMPESVLPYVIHLLSYHPEFPEALSAETDSDKKKVRGIVKCVKMVLRVLQNSLRNETNNQSFIFKQVNMISQRYVDAHNADNIGTMFVARIAAKVLLENVKSSESIQAYPRDIQLPVELFEPKATNGKKEKGSSSSAASAAAEQRMMEMAEATIDRVLKGASKGIGASSAATAGLGSPVPKGRKSPTAAKSPAVKRMFDADSEEEEGNDADEDAKPARQNGGVAKKAKTTPAKATPSKTTTSRTPVAPSAAVAEQPARRMPGRGAKGAANYADPEEEDLEDLERWHAEARNASASKKRPAPKQIQVQQSQSDRSSWEVEEQSDDYGASSSPAPGTLKARRGAAPAAGAHGKGKKKPSAVAAPAPFSVGSDDEDEDDDEAIWNSAQKKSKSKDGASTAAGRNGGSPAPKAVKIVKKK